MSDLLQTIKDQIAQENYGVNAFHHAPDWKQLELWPEVCKRYAFEVAKEALNMAGERMPSSILCDRVKEESTNYNTMNTKTAEEPNAERVLFTKIIEASPGENFMDIQDEINNVANDPGHAVVVDAMHEYANQVSNHLKKRIEELEAERAHYTEGMGFEEVTTCKWGGDRNACGNETCWDLNECQNSPEVKYIRLLHEKQVQKEESQEELLTEFIQKLLLRTSIEELKKEFTIKRKES